jgi:predicted O-methyltransferase YrrM
MLTRIKRWFHEAPEPVRVRYLALRDLRNYALHGRFYAVKHFCDGMLQPGTYRALYDAIYRAPEGDILEVGAAAGAGSIVMAWALADAGRDSKVVSVEKCEGGSRLDFGDRDSNYARLMANLRAFGAVERVDLFPHYLTGENAGDLVARFDTPRLGGLVLDADGRLDRDFRLMWPRLSPGAPIVVDDYENYATYEPRTSRMPDGGMKKLLTYRLLNQLEDWGLFVRDRQLGDTVFGHKPMHDDFSAFDRAALERIVSTLDEEYRRRVGSQARPEALG